MLTDYRTVDNRDFRRAHLLEAAAEELLKDLVPPIRRRQKSDTTGPRREQLREYLKSTPAADAVHVRARRLLNLADALYWRIIDRHEGQITKQALDDRKLAPVLYQDVDTLKSILRPGWFRAALRYDPDKDVKFPTYAVFWGRSELQRSNDRQTTVHLGEGRKVRQETKGWGYVQGVFGAEYEFEFGSSDAGNPEAQVIERERRASLLAAIDALPPQHQTVLTSLQKGENLASTARKLGVSKNRVWQVKNEIQKRILAAVA